MLYGPTHGDAVLDQEGRGHHRRVAGQPDLPVLAEGRNQLRTQGKTL